MPVALPYDVRLRLLRVTDGRTDEQFGINMVGWILYGNMVDFPFIVSLYVSDLLNVTKKYHPHSASQVPYGTRQNSYTSTFC